MEAKKRGLLEEITILDLADEKGSFCSKLLADMGAHVIKVEKPGGDASRLIGPFLGDSPHPEKSLSFSYNNTNKLGITLNIMCDTGRELFAKLIRKTGVVIESFPPGYLDDLGLGFATLSEINPKLIMVSITGFGQTGPRKDFKSCDLVASAVGGQIYVSGSPSLAPIKAYGDQSYITASLFAAVGILLALQGRAKTGRGQHIDISLQEAVASTLEHVLVRYYHDRVIPKRQGNRHWDHFFYILPCKDGHIHLTPFQYWETLVEWLDSDGMAKDLLDEKWKDEDYRMKHADHVIKVLGEWTKTHTTTELFELGQLMRFPWAPVCSPNEVLSSPQLRERRFFKDIKGPEDPQALKYPGLPYKFSEGFSVPGKRAPLIGEDNLKIYMEVLGLTGEDIASLSSKGVI
jgi:benzylsuccinate CoA-transferase BbsE subunit